MAYGRGHCRGTKKEQKGSTDWYASIQAQHLARIEQEWAATPVVTTGTPAYAQYASAFVQARDAAQAAQDARWAAYEAAWDAKPAGTK